MAKTPAAAGMARSSWPFLAPPAINAGPHRPGPGQLTSH
jgi:hypothetical protein